MAVLTVGAGKQFATLAGAVSAAQSGDDIQVQAGTYTNDFPSNVSNLTIEGVGGMATFVSTQNVPNDKAQFVTGGNVTLRNIEVSGVRGPSGNDAAVRYQGGNLTLDHVYFHDNQEGILAADDPNGSITIESSEISLNGNTYLQHNVYINNVGKTVVNNSYIHDVLGGGSEFRSRGANTTITNSRIVDQGHGDNYTVDLPAGGVVLLQNNVFEKAAGATNPIMIHYAPDQQVPWHSPSSLTVTGNTFLNDAGSSSYGVYNQNGPGVTNGGPVAITADVSNNSVYGLSTAHFVVGPANQSGTTYLTSEPAISSAHPWQSAPAPAPTPAPTPTPTPTPAPTPTPTPTPTPAPSGTHDDTLVLHLSEDPFQGDAQAQVYVDGRRLGAPITVTASHAAGASQEVDLSLAAIASGTHTVDVQFLNGWQFFPQGGQARDLYVNPIQVGTQSPSGVVNTVTYGSGTQKLLNTGDMATFKSVLIQHS